jgi:hypothetical protein
VHNIGVLAGSCTEKEVLVGCRWRPDGDVDVLRATFIPSVKSAKLIMSGEIGVSTFELVDQ